jgi:hypothetical protein
MPTHVVLILPSPDWIQLTNVQRKIDKYKTKHLYTMTTIVGKLKGIKDVVLHVVGHGNMLGPCHTTIDNLAETIFKSDLEDGSKIKLETCESASLLVTSSFCEILLKYLKDKKYGGYTNLTIVGSVGCSITGFKSGHQYVLAGKEGIVGFYQSLLEKIHSTDLTKAKNAMSGWNDNLDEITIEKMAFDVDKNTTSFFNGLELYIKTINTSSFQIISDINAYKQQLQSTTQNLTILQTNLYKRKFQ